MDTWQLKGAWKEVRGKLKQKYAQLTDDDLLFEKGQEDELIGRIQKRLGKTRDDVKKELENL